MRRKIFLSFRLISLMFAGLTALAGLSACMAGGGGGSGATALARYDFGAMPDDSVPPVHLSAPIRLGPVTAAPSLSTDAFQYRLRYADDHQLHAYASSRWMAPPPQLFTARLRDQIARQGRVLDSSDGGPSVPMLKVDLDEFSQVFDKPGESQGVVRLRETLLRGSTLIAQQSFVASSPAASADAAGGAHALSVAGDAVIGQLLAWLATQSL